MGVVFLGVVEALKFGGTQLLDIPSMKVLMADKAQQGDISIWHFFHTDAGQVAAIANERRRVAMFQTPVAIFYGIEHEHIAFVGRLGLGPFVVPKIDFGFTNFLGIGQEAAAIERRQRTRHHKFMGNAAGGKLAAPEIAHFKGTVDQFVVICGQVLTKALLVDFDRAKACGHSPVAVFEGQKRQCMGQFFLAMHTQAKAGAIEKTALHV